jgi:hypothetical protein
LETLDFERSRARKADDERRVNLYLKAEHMARNLTEISQLSLLAAQLEFSKIIDGRPVKGTRSSDDLTVKRPEQLSELWNNLSDFVSAPGAINEIRDITRNFDAAEAYLARVKEVPDSGESPLAGYYGAIKDSAFVLGEIMSSFTKTYSKEVDGRGEMLYGTPDDFDPHEFDDPKP